MSTTFIIFMTGNAIACIAITALIIYSIIKSLINENSNTRQEAVIGTFCLTIWALTTINVYIFFFSKLYS